MVSLFSLWLPILLSAVAVWIISFIVWVVLPHHKSDYKKVANEDAARDALKGLKPGLYNVPHVTARSDLQKPEVQKIFNDGPNGFLTILPNGIPTMGKSMILSFIFYLAVSFMVGYVVRITVPAGADYLLVFRIAGTVAWLAYGFGLIQEAVWFGRPWSAIFKNLFDALLYGLVTARFFGWLWP